ncbi:MAG: PLP-dependent aminotransferase family protein [Coriobacteriales bacterium]|jgi:GntR family transcriptional regulator/MocR family aminotransferase|nr:PLP-dependent aminotransferase family protein [Coriobacteriales bacterium]
MLTVVFEPGAKASLYEQLYRAIRSEIESGGIAANEKLPSKRKLATHLNISQCTVENAYAQLIAEGYLTSVEKKGYYANSLKPIARHHIPKNPPRSSERGEKTTSWQATAPPSLDSALPKRGVPNDGSRGVDALGHPGLLAYDLRTNSIDTRHFPYSVWSKLMRECMRDEPDRLVSPVDPQGDFGLRTQIARHLREFRALDVAAEQIVLGAGTEYLLGMLTELLPEANFGIEDPGYHTFSSILQSRKRRYHPVAVDDEGLVVRQLETTAAQVALVTPSHQFPLGVIMSIARRQQLLNWAMADARRFIIEDDFNSGFHFGLRPVPALFCLDGGSRVIYLNSFANSLAPSLRIAYMVLPHELLARYRATLRFYSCTVSTFEQLTLKRFLRDGYFERHLNRMRKVYRRRQAALIEGLAPLRAGVSGDGSRCECERGCGCGEVRVFGQLAGLHLLISAQGLPEQELVRRAAQQGVGVYPLSAYHYGSRPETHTVIAGFAGYPTAELTQAVQRLAVAWTA